MFGFLKRVVKKRLNFEKLQILQMVVQQVVLSIEGSIRMPGASKKAMAVEIVGKILKEMEIVAPDSLVDAMIESAVQILNAMDLSRGIKSQSNFSKFSYDITGRPKSGN